MTKLFWLSSACVLMMTSAFAQQTISGRVVDANTKELLTGVTVHSAKTTAATHSDQSGKFTINVSSADDSLTFSYMGYATLKLKAGSDERMLIQLKPSASELQHVIVTASRAQRARTDEAVAVSTITAKTIQETNPTRLGELMNKVPGVIMQDLGNEQHAMSIRQPMTKRPYFLYLEDGIPIAPVGNFNHNQLIEVNMLGVRSIEVLKGPASSFYGSNAVGGAVNFITQSPSFSPTAKIGLQANNYGYQRLEFYVGTYVTDKLGVSVGGYLAKQRDGWQEFSDFDKLSLSLKTVYNITNKTRLTGYVTTNNLNTETGGSIDSAGFYTKKYLSNNNFSYRKVNATRGRLTLDKEWNKKHQSSATVYYGNNTIGQLPRYRIKNINKQRASGEENEDAYDNYGAVVQHNVKLDFLKSAIFGGVSFNYAPTRYNANYLAITRDTVTGYYTSYTDRNDSLLANYTTGLSNAGAWLQYELSPVKKLKFIAGLRYDLISYNYHNKLSTAAFSGVPDTVITNNAFSPKLGAIYSLGNGRGIYANYSRGLSAPQVSDLFFGKKVPNLKPAYFDNYEIGGWAALYERKIYLDVSLYQLNGYNEIVSFTLPDNSTENRNAGKTLHRGIEYSVTYTPIKDISLRVGGTNAVHKYVQYAVQQKSGGEVTDFDGNDMPEAPKFIANAELTLKPRFVKGLRIGLEWQRMSPWYKNDANTHLYDDKTLVFKGVSILNLRTGYRFKQIEGYVNVLNLTDELYANSATRSSSNKDSYSAGAPRIFAFGLLYHFGQNSN
ncbi:TonB-dependent receptor [Polluticoccus soli]|uniref:TonB-dependent receptor n=1 Tax=Polluticoccus soli TaxID=3034150 RepID=UPI0023E24699|nr:TonB-dependent receptor [Flavipsychrobacter sp. JY13-12]